MPSTVPPLMFITEYEPVSSPFRKHPPLMALRGRSVPLFIVKTNRELAAWANSKSFTLSKLTVASSSTTNSAGESAASIVPGWRLTP